MAHTAAEAQDFLSRAAKIAEPLKEIGTALAMMAWTDAPFLDGEDTPDAADLAGSAYADLDPAEAMTAIGLILAFMTENQAALVKLEKFNK